MGALLAWFATKKDALLGWGAALATVAFLATFAYQDIALRISRGETLAAERLAEVYKTASDINRKAAESAIKDRALAETTLKDEKDAAVARAASLYTQLERSKHAKDGPASDRLNGAFEWLQPLFSGTRGCNPVSGPDSPGSTAQPQPPSAGSMAP